MSLSAPILGNRASAPVRPGFPPGSPPNTRAPTVLGRGAGAYGPLKEAAALALWALALFLVLALASYQGDPEGLTPAVSTPAGSNWVGPVGALCARALVSRVGVDAC